MARQSDSKARSCTHTLTRGRRTVPSVRASLSAAAAAFALLAGCAAESGNDDVEALIEDRVEAALVELAASTTTEAAVDIEALIEERVEAAIEERVEADLDARPTWAELSVQFACHDALDDLERKVREYDSWSRLDGDAASAFRLFLLATHELSVDGKFDQELEADRICAAARRVGTSRGHLAFSERLDRLQEPATSFLRIYSACNEDADFDFGGFASSVDAESLTRTLCKKVRARFGH